MSITIPNTPAQRPTPAHSIPARRPPYRPEHSDRPLSLGWLEETALNVARSAGAFITASLERDLEVSYKEPGRGLMAPSDAVSNVDRDVEVALRAQLATRHPDHGFLGEETGRSGLVDAEYLWVVDPVDGTMNFVNGVPLFASTVAVLHRGVPVAGATWCASTHALRPGVYHARAGGELHFEGVPYRQPRQVSGLQRSLSTAPMPSPRQAAHWDHRHIGSAATESAYVAAGLLASTRLSPQRAWDVAGGVVLAQAAGHEVWTQHGSRWQAFTHFGDDVEHWSQPVLFASSEALDVLRPALL